MTACVSELDKDGKPKRTENDVYAYVAQIAQGLALQIDNDLAKACQKAAQEAMISACGDTESCDVTVDLASLKPGISVVIKDKNNKEYQNIASVGTNEVLRRKKLKTVIKGLPDVSAIIYGQSADGGYAFSSTTVDTDMYDAANTTKMVNLLNAQIKSLISSIESNRDVTYCMTGRQVQGFDGSKFGKKKVETYKDKDGKDQTASADDARFPNLTDEYKGIIANSLRGKLSAENIKLRGEYLDAVAAIDKEIIERIYAADEKDTDEANYKSCLHNYTIPDALRCKQITYNDEGKEQTSDGSGEDCDDGTQTAASGTRELTDQISTYDYETNICTVQTIHFTCPDWKKIFMGSNYCAAFDNGTVTNTRNIQMPKSN